MSYAEARDPRPMLATAASALPAGPQWSYEVKWDGYRALAIKDGERIQLVFRNEKNRNSSEGWIAISRR